jgi:hypothetical protein
MSDKAETDCVCRIFHVGWQPFVFAVACASDESQR